MFSLNSCLLIYFEENINISYRYVANEQSFSFCNEVNKYTVVLHISS